MREPSRLSRRQALELLLGAPLAAEACRRPRPRDYPGRLLGPSLQVGHRLRDLKLEQAPAEETPLGIAIVGGGPSGLSAAWRLERLGYRDYRVFELEPEAGGTSIAGRDGVVPYPWGAHYVPMPSADNAALGSLLSELGAVSRAPDGRLVPSERALIRAPEERLFQDGAWYEGLFPRTGASPEDLSEMARFEQLVARWVAFRDARGRRAFAVPMRLCSDAAEVKELDRVSAASFLRAQGFRSPRVLWYAEYACRDDYGLALEHTSAWAMLFYFCARVPEPGASSQPFLSWPEGNGRLVAHLSSLVGERLSPRHLVTDLVHDERGVRLCALDVASGSLRAFRAAAAIVAVPKFIAARIVRGLDDAARAAFGAFELSSWLVANLHLKRRPSSSGFPFAWDNVLYDSPSLGYVVATHQRLADLGPTIWTYYLPLLGDAKGERRKLESLDRAACVDSIVSDLSRAHVGLEDAIERIDVWRWGHAMVSPRPGFIWGGARERASAPCGERIFFAHSDLSGLALFEEAQDRGVRAAEAALRALGRDVPAL